MPRHERMGSQSLISGYDIKRALRAGGAFIALVLFLAGSLEKSYAVERELASEDSEVQLTIDSSYICDKDATVNIRAESAAYFDQSPQVIQRLVNVASVVLGFECPAISHVKFIGYTEDAVIFKADAEKKKNWALQTEPAPLESLALVYGLYEPHFFHLGSIYGLWAPYREVNGIKDTYQYSALNKQIGRLAGIVNGDIDRFRSYLINPGQKFAEFDDADNHYKNILEAINIHAPNYHEKYNEAYRDISRNLKNEYWIAHVETIIYEQGSVPDSLKAALQLVKDSRSQEFVIYVDEHLAVWFEEEAEYILSDLSNAPLYEVAWASDFITELPNHSKFKALPKTAQLINNYGEKIIEEISQRLDPLQSLAIETLKSSGDSYTAVDAILETGFALAEDFENAGFVEHGEFILGETMVYIENTLQSKLSGFQNELANIEISGATVAALHEQAVVFDELSTQFDGFVAYKDAVDKVLEKNKEKICSNILAEADVSSWQFDKRIFVGEEPLTVVELACELYEHDHMVSGFTWNWTPGQYTLSITDAEGVTSQYLLKADSVFFSKDLHVTSRIGDNDEAISEEQWAEYIAQLVLPPPSGEPDARGVRECDTLAADPHDSNKLATGIDFEKEDIDMDIFERALDACVAAVENNPEDVRQLFQLGRLLWYAGDQENSEEYVSLAAEADYAPAIYYRAEILLASSDDPDAFIDALEMFKKSGKKGYERGNNMVKELNPDGIDFFKKIAPPTEMQLANALGIEPKSASFMGVTTTVVLVGTKIKDCFQTSKSDFSCEYDKVLKCDMSSRGGGSMLNFMSSILQSDCNTTSYQFGSFRKLGSGKWKKLPKQF